jgi:hypothetical protein
MEPEKQKLGYLRLTKECHESMIDLTANGVSVLALKNIIERANRLGIDHIPLEEEHALISSGSNNNTPFVWETKEKDDLNHNLNTDGSSEMS